MTQKWCQRCRKWFPKYDACSCGFTGTGFNKYLMRAKLDNHLYAQQERAVKERTDSAHFVAQAKREAKRAARS